MKITIDDTDWHILTLLQENARLSFTELGRLVGLSRPAVAERVRRLEEEGIISGYHAQVNLVDLGYPIMALVRISAARDILIALSATIKEMPEVMECHRGTGSDCFILKVVAPSLSHLETVFDRLIPYGQVTSSIILSSIVTRRIITNLPMVKA